MYSQWPVISVDKDSPELFVLLRSIYNNEIAALVIKNFWSEEKCKKAVGAIMERGFDYYEGVYPPIGRIGITQFEHRSDDEAKSRYFSRAPGANAIRADLFHESGDPVSEVIRLFHRFTDTHVAIESTNEQYFAGLVRNIHEALLHLDFAPRDAAGWDISKILAQASWNIILQDAESGGQAVVYRRLWNKDDESKKVQESYGYSMELVHGCQEVIITGEVGDFIVFNSQNFHRVLSTQGKRLRLTVSSFIGLTRSDTLLLWS